MALSDKWTRAQLRTAVRRELMDPNGKWWTDAEINESLSAWNDELQQQFEFVWGTYTTTGTQVLYTASNLSPEPLRFDAAYWSDTDHHAARIPPITKQELDILFREWRYLNVGYPSVVVQPDAHTMQLVPAPQYAGTMILEYPITVSLNSDSAMMSAPAWTRYSAIPYCCYRAYRRLGPNQDINRALAYKTQLAAERARISSIKQSRFPTAYPALRPAGAYERSILKPTLCVGGITLPGTISRGALTEATITGTQNSVNTIFTLSVAPTTLILSRNGLVLSPLYDYTLNGFTITFVVPPKSTDLLRALAG